MFDANNCFTIQTDGTLVQAVTADAASTNIIDLDVAGLNIAAGARPIYLILKAITPDSSGGCVSMEVFLETDSDSGFATTKKEIQMWRFLGNNSGSGSQLTAGALLINQPLLVANYQRYVRLYFNAWTNAIALTFFGALADGPESAQTDVDLEVAGS